MGADVSSDAGRNDMTLNIVIKTQFEAIHRWPGCPFEEVMFLRCPHRHIFHVMVKFPVKHTDRDREFIMAKHEVSAFVSLWNNKDLGTMSCEDMAVKIQTVFPDSCFVSVFEDNENGAELSKD